MVETLKLSRFISSLCLVLVDCTVADPDCITVIFAFNGQGSCNFIILLSPIGRLRSIHYEYSKDY